MEHVQLIKTGIDHERLHREVLDLEIRLGLHCYDQITVTNLDGSNDLTAANGRLTELEKEERYYNQIVEYFKGSYIEDCVNMFPDYYRWRLLKLQPKKCYSIHIDSLDPDIYNFRLHVPVVSNDQCFMTFYDNQPKADETHCIKHYYLAPGNAYITNTTGWHTAINYGSEDRWHLVGVKYIDKGQE